MSSVSSTLRGRDGVGAFAEKFSGNRPEPFRDNKLYVTMLVDVPTRIVTAMIMINFGRPDIARNSLQAIREEMSAVRRASGVEVLADCVSISKHAMAREWYKGLMLARKLIEYEDEKLSNVASGLSKGG